ncbi:hypothetical protein DNK47_00770 [Mycoplasma wenyonii]|uniref:Uncharacterized protein n=1 Tax=Mycoplasma wenyonii TaxID=65123 RepID=A0A328PR78_9MOLU|nr:hypothetical protein [Mycoplasma wenyonii]RAO95368.1 hypothetical protein DNK47_00770 [Mycoplasma wenyonii]
MSAYIKLISLICGAGIGLGGGIPLAIKALQVSSNNTGIKEGQAVVSSSASTSPSPSNSVGQSIRTGDREASEIQKQRAKSREQGNCVVLDDSDEITDVLWKFDKLSDDYTAIYCQNTNTETSVKISNWTGIFSDDLLLNSWSLRAGDRFDVTTETKTLGSGDYQTIFNGNRMETPITGEWGEPVTTDKGKSVMIVKILEPKGSQESIYLLFEGNSK